MRTLLFLTALVLLSVCMSQPMAATLEGLECSSIAFQREEHTGACFGDFWNDYKTCFGRISTGTGCTVLVGREVPAWCYPENCAALHAKDPQRFSLWSSAL